MCRTGFGPDLWCLPQSNQAEQNAVEVRLSRRRSPVIKTFALCLFATAALASSGCGIDVQGSGIGGYASTREQKRLTLTGAPNLTVKTFNGSIELRPGERNEILVDIERRASTLDVLSLIHISEPTRL